MLGSHNSFTYGRPKNLLSKLVAPWSRCQTKNIFNQVAAGVKVLDLRLKFHPEGGTTGSNSLLDKFIVAHGLYLPDVDWKSDLEYINSVNHSTFLKEGTDLNFTSLIWVRVILEHTKRDLEAEIAFKRLIPLLQSLYPCISFTGGNIKADWTSLVQLSPLPYPDIQVVSSMHTFNKCRENNTTPPYLNLFGHRILLSVTSLLPTKWYSRKVNPVNLPLALETANRYISLDHI